MKINDFINVLLDGENREFSIYAENEQPIFEGYGGDIPTELTEAEIDSIDIGAEAIEIITK